MTLVAFLLARSRRQSTRRAALKLSRPVVGGREGGISGVNKDNSQTAHT